jgi:hypothetical protein
VFQTAIGRRLHIIDSPKNCLRHLGLSVCGRGPCRFFRPLVSTAYSLALPRLASFMFQHTRTHNKKNRTKQLESVKDCVRRLGDRFLVFEWYDLVNEPRVFVPVGAIKPRHNFPPSLSSSPSSPISPSHVHTLEMPATNGVYTNGVHTNGVHTNGVTAHPSETRPKDVGILAMEMYFPYRVRL